jgi:hypothetical protein
LRAKDSVHIPLPAAANFTQRDYTVDSDAPLNWALEI